MKIVYLLEPTLILRTCIILFIILSGFSVQAQMGLVWVDSFTPLLANPGSDVGSLEVDANGMVYSSGHFTGIIDFDSGPGSYPVQSVGYGDIYIRKLDASGNFLWVKTIGSQLNNGWYVSHSLKVDATGNVFFKGGTSVTLDVDPGPGVYNISPTPGSLNGFIIKLDASGNLLGVLDFPNMFLNAMEPDPLGNLLVAGTYFQSVDLDPGPGTVTTSPNGFFISKFDAAGSFLWGKSFATPNLILGAISALATDNAGNVCSGGNFQTTIDFDPGPGAYNLSPIGYIDAFITKLDASGNFIWAKSMGGPGNEWLGSIDIGANGAVYSTGSFAATADFDPGPATAPLTATWFSDAFIQKLDASGNFLWARQLGNANPINISMKADANDDLYAVGYFRSTLDIDPGPGIYSVNASGTSNNFYISKLNGSGNLVSGGKIGGLDPMGSDEVTSFTFDNSGFIYVMGVNGFLSYFDYDPGPHTYSLNAPGGQRFVEKICQFPGPPLIITGSSTLCSAISSTYAIAPSPIATSYSWVYPGAAPVTGTATSISFSAASSGNLVVTSNLGCAFGSVSITVTPTPTLTVNSGSICPGQSFVMTPSGADAYVFQGGTATVSPLANSSYSIAGTNTAGCLSTPVIASVAVIGLPQLSVPGGSICAGHAFTLSPISNATTYTFSSGQAIVSPSVTSSYTIMGANELGCIGAPAVATVQVSDMGGSVSFLKQQVQCLEGNRFDLKLQDELAPGTLYTWDFGAVASPSVSGQAQPGPVSFTQAGLFWISLKAQFEACRDSFMDSVRVVDPMPAPAVNWDTTVVIGQSAPLNAFAGTEFIYTWTPVTDYLDCITCLMPNSISTPTASIVYTVQVEDRFHCHITSSTYKVVVDAKASIDVPTAFTPNGDGINDKIFAAGWGLKKLHYFKVFNRWGELVFETDQPEAGWDGSFNGVPQNSETYIYQVSAETYVDGQTPLVKSGAFQLVR